MTWHAYHTQMPLRFATSAAHVLLRLSRGAVRVGDVVIDGVWEYRRVKS